MEAAIIGALGFDPFGRAGFQFLDDLGNRLDARQIDQSVNVIRRSVHRQRRAAGVFEDGCTVRVQF